MARIEPWTLIWFLLRLWGQRIGKEGKKCLQQVLRKPQTPTEARRYHEWGNEIRCKESKSRSLMMDGSGCSTVEGARSQCWFRLPGTQWPSQRDNCRSSPTEWPHVGLEVWRGRLFKWSQESRFSCELSQSPMLVSDSFFKNSKKKKEEGKKNYEGSCYAHPHPPQTKFLSAGLHLQGLWWWALDQSKHI